LDFWIIIYELSLTSSAESTSTITIKDSEIFNLEERDIHVIHHPYVIPLID
jgi:hypothetical protein